MLDVLLVMLVLICLITDLKERKIYNTVLLPGVVAGIGINIYTAGMNGLFFSIFGLLAGLFLLLVPFASGGIGAGDVKLLACVGAYKGVEFVFYAFLGMGLAGGLLAVIVLLKQQRLIKTLKEIRNGLLVLITTRFQVVSFGGNNEKNMFPYGVAIALGVFSSYMMG